MGMPDARVQIIRVQSTQRFIPIDKYTSNARNMYYTNSREYEDENKMKTINNYG